MQVVDAPAPESVHVENVPVLFVVRMIVPVGATVGIGEVSDTVTVQAAEPPTVTVAGQIIPIELVLSVEVIVPLVPLLVEWTLSP